MKWRLFGSMLLAAAVLLACNLFSNLGSATPGSTGSSNPGSATPGPAGSSKAYQYVFETPTEPISLTVSLDTSASVEAVIPVQGGSLSATGADGTTYTLEIPGDALLNDIKIRMTPANNVAGLPFGGKQAYAVQLAPEGLSLFNFATLTITPAQAIPLDQQITFGYKASGKNFGLAAPMVDSKEIKIRLLHFSGYGVTQGLLADIEPVRQRLGGDADSRLESLASEYATRERQRQETGQGDNTQFGRDLADLLQQYETQVVNPRVAAAGESCAAGRLAIQSMISLERTRQLLGMGESATFAQDFQNVMTIAGKVCVREEYQMCVDQHIIHRMIPVWLGFKRQYELLGGADSGPEPEELKLAEELTKKCLTFELQFDSNGIFDAGGGDGYSAAVTAKIRLQFDPAVMKITGEGPLESKSFEFRPPATCTATSKTGGGTFQVNSLEYVTGKDSEEDKLGFVSDFNLNFWPGVSSESYHVDCPPTGTSKQEAHYTSPPSGYWSGMFFVTHTEELNAQSTTSGAVPEMPDISGMLAGAQAGAIPALPAPDLSGGGGFLADRWDVPGGELFAQKEWDKSQSEAGVFENGSLKLYHKPGS